MTAKISEVRAELEEAREQIAELEEALEQIAELEEDRENLYQFAELVLAMHRDEHPRHIARWCNRDVCRRADEIVNPS